MCGRYSLTSPLEAVRRLFDVTGGGNLAPRFNIAPTQGAAVVRLDPAAPSGRALDLLIWGLVPSWAKEAAIGSRLINARAETVAEKPSFRAAFGRRRCLVPADGFYEWQGRAGQRRPHHLTLPGSTLFAIAGLYERWLGPGGEVVDSFTLLTRPARGAVAALHDRMPVIVDPEGYAAWLERAASDPATLLAALPQERGEELLARPVSARVNDVHNDDLDCLADPVEETLPLFRAPS